MTFDVPSSIRMTVINRRLGYQIYTLGSDKLYSTIVDCFCEPGLQHAAATPPELGGLPPHPKALLSHPPAPVK